MSGPAEHHLLLFVLFCQIQGEACCFLTSEDVRKGSAACLVAQAYRHCRPSNGQSELLPVANELRSERQGNLRQDLLRRWRHYCLLIASQLATTGGRLPDRPVAVPGRHGWAPGQARWRGVATMPWLRLFMSWGVGDRWLLALPSQQCRDGTAGRFRTASVTAVRLLLPAASVLLF